MRFIHAADIHLDSPLTGLGAYADAPAQALRTATRDAFTALVDLAINEQVDFMIIAGDLYDGNWKDHNTGLYFVAQMGRLNRARIPVYLLHGNHDAANDMTRGLLMPENVFVFGTERASTFVLDELKVALHGHSFKVAATTDNLAVQYPAPIDGMFNIGVLHTALEGNAQHATYAPCSLDELQARGYQYWALGHVHEYAIWRGDAVVVFPGNLQGRHIRESGPRGAVMVSCDDLGHVDVHRIFVDVLRWETVQVNVSACLTFNDAVRTIGAALDAIALDKGADRPLALRVVVCGTSVMHGELFGLEHQLRAEVLAQVAAIGNERLWLEKVQLATQPPAQALSRSEHVEALDDLAEYLKSAQTDPDFRAGLQADLLALVGKAPAALHDSIPWFSDIRTGELDALLQEVRPALMAQLDKAD